MYRVPEVMKIHKFYVDTLKEDKGKDPDYPDLKLKLQH